MSLIELKLNELRKKRKTSPHVLQRPTQLKNRTSKASKMNCDGPKSTPAKTAVRYECTIKTKAHRLNKVHFSEISIYANEDGKMRDNCHFFSLFQKACGVYTVRVNPAGYFHISLLRRYSSASSLSLVLLNNFFCFDYLLLLTSISSDIINNSLL